MREYSKVYPRYWQSGTGKSLRGDMEAQLLSLYLMTCPHANMIGVFHCPVMYMAHETGMTHEGAYKALQRLIEVGFCTFDGDDEVIWVHEMAAHQIGTSLSVKDKQVLGIAKQYAQITQTQIRRGFYERYKAAYHLHEEEKTASPLQAPCKPLRSQEQEQEQEQELKPSDTDVSLVASNADDVKQEVGQASDIPDCPHQEILNLYADALPELPQPRSWDGSRAENLRRRWRWVLTAKRRNDGGRYATDKDSGLLFFRRLFCYVNGSDFLMGRSGGWTGCDLGWIVKAENFEKILAGNYENRATA